MEYERETIRQMLIGALALDPGIRDKALEVLEDVDNHQRRKLNQPTGDPDIEQAA